MNGKSREDVYLLSDGQCRVVEHIGGDTHDLAVRAGHIGCQGYLHFERSVHRDNHVAGVVVGYAVQFRVILRREHSRRIRRT